PGARLTFLGDGDAGGGEHRGHVLVKVRARLLRHTPQGTHAVRTGHPAFRRLSWITGLVWQGAVIQPSCIPARQSRCVAGAAGGGVVPLGAASGRRGWWRCAWPGRSGVLQTRQGCGPIVTMVIASWSGP